MNFATYPSLKDKSVIVTGGASGIGADIVRAFAEQQSRVAFVDFDVPSGQRLASELASAGTGVRFEPCDLRDITALKRAFRAIAEKWPPEYDGKWWEKGLYEKIRALQ